MSELRKRPEGYSSKDAIFSAIEDLMASGCDMQNIRDELILENILAATGFEEKRTTISSYKSQYFKQFEHRKILHQEMFKLGIRIAPILQKHLEEGISKDTLKEAVILTIEALEEPN